MNEQEIHEDYTRIFNLDEQNKASELESLRSTADEADLREWVDLIDARLSIDNAKYSDAVNLSTTLIEREDVSDKVKSWSLLNRGVAYSKSGEPEKEIADYNALIENPDTPSEQQAWALFNRGVTYVESGDPEKAFADYNALIENPDTPSELRAWALYNRGVEYGRSGEPEKAVADYNALIENPDATSEQQAKALYNRGAAYDESGETEKAFADYNALIENPDTPSEQQAQALINRGVEYGESGEPEKAIADFNALIENPDAPSELRTWALINRGAAYGKSGDPEKAFADFNALIENPDTPSDLRAKALFNRGVAYGKSGETEKAVADCNALIESPDAPDYIKSIARTQRDWLKNNVDDLEVKFDPEMCDDFKRQLKAEGERRRDFFDESLFDLDASFLLIAREWNSFTPAVPEEGESSRGGGYFLKHLGSGVVIDPGFNFLEIFSEAGGRLSDIDHVVITHAHNDHTAELETILMLFHEYNHREGIDASQRKQFKLHMSQGAARKFAGIVPLKGVEYIDEIVTLNRGRTEHPQVVWLNDQIQLTVLPAFHDDLVTENYAIGLGIKLSFDEESTRRIVFTSDTGFYPKGKSDKDSPPIHQTYPEPFCCPEAEAGNVDLVVAHIGSIKEFELEGPLGWIQAAEGTFSVGKTYENHLGLRGTIFLLHELSPKAAVVSEFGEEMRGIWVKAVRAISSKLDELRKGRTMPVFAGDPVVLYNVRDGTFLCHEDRAFRNGSDLKMFGMHQPGPNRQNGPIRPYLFLRESSIEDGADTEDQVGEFHKALRDRNLPHFRQKS